MDVTDALRRIVMRHLVLIAIATLVPILGFAAYKSGQPPMYTASVQLQVGENSAASVQAATAQADTAIAQVKTQDAVLKALIAADKADPALKIKHGPDDAASFLANDLAVAQVLTSPNITISVKADNKQAAVDIDQALALETIDTKYTQAAKQFVEAQAAADSALALAQKTSIDANNALAKAGLTPAPALQVAANQAGSALAIAQANDQKAKDNVTGVFKPQLVDTAKIVPETTLAKLQPYVLVLILGLILGVGIAAVIESAAPSVVGAAGLAGLFGAPHLGYAVGRTGKAKGRITDLALAARLHAAARRVGADTVVIAGDIRCDLPDLAGRLDALLGGATNQQIVGQNIPGQSFEGPGALDPKMLNAGDGSKELATRQNSAPALFSERLSFGEDIPSVWVHPRVVPYDEQVLLLLSTAPVSVAVAVVGAPKGKRRNLIPAIELVETSGWEILGTIVADPTHKAGTV
jgi:capsular polysaccharide biosynthesis protein